jgi:hypothetical protein
MNGITIIERVTHPVLKIQVPLIDVTSVPLTMLGKKKDTVLYRGAPAHWIMSEVREWTRLQTLEGAMSMPDHGVWILVGVKNEPWFVSYEELFATYRGVRENPKHPGWTDFAPLGAVRQVGLVDFTKEKEKGFAILGEYGEIARGTFPGKEKKKCFVMFSKGPASFVVHDPASLTNYWLVEPEIYKNTYDTQYSK